LQKTAPSVAGRRRTFAKPFLREGFCESMTPKKEKCLNCRNFRNNPQYLEKVFKGLNILSSGHASVRKDDGVCLLHDIYLSADALCEQHQPDSTGERC
jgi:hypothetical protein